MDIAATLSEYLAPAIVALCLCVGYIIKHWIKDADNKIIPTVCAVLGVTVACLTHLGQITVDVIVGGLVSGLASTGLHQAFYQWIYKEEEK